MQFAPLYIRQTGSAPSNVTLPLQPPCPASATALLPRAREPAYGSFILGSRPALAAGGAPTHRLAAPPWDADWTQRVAAARPACRRASAFPLAVDRALHGKIRGGGGKRPLPEAWARRNGIAAGRAFRIEPNSGLITALTFWLTRERALRRKIPS